MSDKLFPVCAVFTHNAVNSLTDWLSWHLALGFKKIFIIDYDSDDGTEELAHIIAKKYPIEWHQPEINKELSPSEKRLALTHYCLTLFKKIYEKQTLPQWFCILDSDEFLDPYPNLQTILQKHHNQKAIFLNWCFYGSLDKKSSSKKHLIAACEWRADKLFSDHQFGRPLFQFSALPEIKNITDPLLLNISSKNLIASDGSNYTPSSSAPIWGGGRILHYVHPQKNSHDSLSQIIFKYYNRSDIHDVTPQQNLYKTRAIQNLFWKEYLESGIEKLKLWAENYAEDDTDFIPDRDLQLPEYAERIGFNYERIRPQRAHRYLLSEQAHPPYGISHIFILQNTTNNHFLTADTDHSKDTSPQKTEEQSPLLALIQEHHPKLISLFFEDKKPFILGDIPVPNGIAVIRTHSSHHNLFTLPEETGHAGTLFHAIPYKNISFNTDILPLPLADEKDGITIDELLLWLEHHPHAIAEDIYRALRLLNPQATQLVIQVIPQLSPFLS